MQACGQIILANGFAARVAIDLEDDWYQDAVSWHGFFSFKPATPFLEFLTATARQQAAGQEVAVFCIETNLANLCGAATIEEQRSTVSWRFQGSGSLIAAPKVASSPTFSGPAYTSHMKRVKTSTARRSQRLEPLGSEFNSTQDLEDQLDATQRQIEQLEKELIVTEQTKQDLLRDRARMESALVSAPVMLFSQNRQQRYTWVESPQWPDLADAMMGKSDAELFTREEARRLGELKRRAIKEETAVRKEVKLTSGAGMGSFLLCLQPQHDPGNGVRGLCGALVDITPQKAAADRRRQEAMKLRQAAEKYHRLFEQSADAIFVCSPSGRLVDVNPAAVELSGYASKAQLLNLSVSDLCQHVEDAQSFELIMSKQGMVKDHPLTLKRKDGRQVNTLITAQVLRNNAGQILAYEGTLRDITAQQRLERRLLEAKKMEAVGVLAGGIAHDFNNLFMVIQGNAELGLASLEEPLPELWQTILKATQSGSRLVQQLIDFSSKQSLAPTVVSGASLSQILFQALDRIEGEGIELRLNISADPGDLYVDAGTLEQIFLNIARNAREAMPHGGTLTVETASVTADEQLRLRHSEAHLREYIKISVSDTGMGMDQETLAHVFEPFFTMKNVVSGLGLAAAYGLVRQQGGFIAASSEPGIGSCFEIYLPRHQSKDAPVQRRRRSRSGAIRPGGV